MILVKWQEGKHMHPEGYHRFLQSGRRKTIIQASCCPRH